METWLDNDYRYDEVCYKWGISTISVSDSFILLCILPKATAQSRAEFIVLLEAIRCK